MRKLKVLLGVFVFAGIIAVANSNSTNIYDLNQNDEIVVKRPIGPRISCSGWCDGNHTRSARCNKNRTLPTNG